MMHDIHRKMFCKIFMHVIMLATNPRIYIIYHNDMCIILHAAFLTFISVI